MKTDDGGDEVGLRSLEGYFNNLTAAATSRKKVLEQLVSRNANLATTNEELVAVVKQLTNKNKDIQRETNRPKKGAAVGRHKGIGSQHCAPIARRDFIMSLMPLLS